MIKFRNKIKSISMDNIVLSNVQGLETHLLDKTFECTLLEYFMWDTFFCRELIIIESHSCWS